MQGCPRLPHSVDYRFDIAVVLSFLRSPISLVLSCLCLFLADYIFYRSGVYLQHFRLRAIYDMHAMIYT